jgi:hypothetical protein
VLLLSGADVGQSSWLALLGQQPAEALRAPVGYRIVLNYLG